MGRSRPVVAVLVIALAVACSHPESSPVAEVLSPAARESSISWADCPAEEGRPAVIRLGITPYVDNEVIRAGFAPVADYLSHAIGIPVELVEAGGYDELVELVADEKVDIASLSPLIYVQARDRMPCLQLLLTQVAQGSTHYSGYLVVRKEAPYTLVEELRGKRIALAPRSSASGNLFSLAFLKEQGHDPESFFSRIVIADDHLAALRLLLDGEVEVVATFNSFMAPARAAQMAVSELRVLAVTGRIPFDAVCARPRLNREVAAAVKDALYKLNTGTVEGRRRLGRVFVINGWVPTEDSFYDEVREKVRQVAGEGTP